MYCTRKLTSSQRQNKHHKVIAVGFGSSAANASSLQRGQNPIPEHAKLAKIYILRSETAGAFKPFAPHASGSLEPFSILRRDALMKWPESLADVSSESTCRPQVARQGEQGCDSGRRVRQAACRRIPQQSRWASSFDLERSIACPRLRWLNHVTRLFRWLAANCAFWGAP